MLKHRDMGDKKSVKSRFTALYDKALSIYEYVTKGVWDDPRKTFGVRLVKTGNLAVGSFLDRDLQIRSMSLTYSTVLAIVPAFALLVAIGRGFGYQELLEGQLYQSFPSQAKAIATALRFVDSYLSSASQGLFVGVGLVVLLWTLISLLSYIESAFNKIWDINEDRSIYQKVTDYIAICLIVPILMICSAGVSIFMSTTIQEKLNFPFITPFINIALETSPVVFAWLAFSFSYFLIPNTKVDFKYAAISGLISAILFQILQLLFVNGQIYVSKYNAIYGSFAFLPLMLVWLQLSWLILLSGCVLTYSLQNVFGFNFLGDASSISTNSWHRMAIIVMAVISQRFIKGEKPLTTSLLAANYNLPVRIVGRLEEKLRLAGLVNSVKLSDNEFGMAPATDVSEMTVGSFIRKFDSTGEQYFIPGFRKIYAEFLSILMPALKNSYASLDTIKIKDLPIPTPGQISDALTAVKPEASKPLE